MDFNHEQQNQKNKRNNSKLGWKRQYCKCGNSKTIRISTRGSEPNNLLEKNHHNLFDYLLHTTRATIINNGSFDPIENCSMYILMMLFTNVILIPLIIIVFSMQTCHKLVWLVWYIQSILNITKIFNDLHTHRRMK